MLVLIWKWRTSTCPQGQVRDNDCRIKDTKLTYLSEDFPYEDRILKLLSECDDMVIRSKASQVLSVLQPPGKKTVPMEPVEETRELIISPRSPPSSLDRQEMSSLSVTVKRSEIDDAPKPSNSLISATYLSPMARKKAKRKSNEAIRKGSDSPSSFKITSMSGSLGRATTRQWRSRSVPDALPNIFNLPSTGSDSALVKGNHYFILTTLNEYKTSLDRCQWNSKGHINNVSFVGEAKETRERDKESKDKDKEKEPKEKKKHRRLSIKRRGVRKSSEGSLKQPRNPVDIDWDKCVLYSYSPEYVKISKINESDLKIENIIGRHRHGMVRSSRYNHIW